jgi:chemotaxis protein methyltransferase CheR
MAVSVVTAQARAGQKTRIAVDVIEIQLLLEGLVRLCGHDFRDYDPAVVKRRIEAAMADERVATVSALQEKAFHDDACLDRLLTRLIVRRTPMFSDPKSFATLRTMAVQLLRTYPFVRIWHAGCSTGQDTYALALLLAEEDLYERSKIYATESLESAVGAARAGVYPADEADRFAANYAAAGGTRSLSEHVERRGADLIVDPDLRKNVVFATHNLASDASFNDFHLILCTNVLGQYGSALQSSAHALLYGSLIRLGFLALGSDQAIQNCPFAPQYRAIGDRTGLYRKMR